MFCIIVSLSCNVFISVYVILRFMSRFVESKAENYETQSIVEFRQSLRKYSILKMVRFFLRSVYKTRMKVSITLIAKLTQTVFVVLCEDQPSCKL